MKQNSHLPIASQITVYIFLHFFIRAGPNISIIISLTGPFTTITITDMIIDIKALVSTTMEANDFGYSKKNNNSVTDNRIIHHAAHFLKFHKLPHSY